MLIISVISIFFMAFRYKNREQCKVVDFHYRTSNQNDVAFSNEPISYSVAGDNVKEWEWDFGDKTPHDKTSGPFTEHTYKQQGHYIVRLTINGRCESVKTISVNNRETEGKKFVMRVQWPTEPLYAGREYYFTDSTDGASTWGWYVDEEPKRTRQSLTHQFTEPGQHTIALVLDDDPEHNKEVRKFNVLPPQTVAPLITTRNNQENTRRRGSTGNNDIQEETSSKSLAEHMKEVTTDKPKLTGLSDTRLMAAVLDINGNGYNEIRGFLLNNSFTNCTILFQTGSFQARTLSVDKLKENMREHAKFGKTLTVKQEVDANGYINMIQISAELKRKDKVAFIGGGERKYPH